MLAAAARSSSSSTSWRCCSRAATADNPSPTRDYLPWRPENNIYGAPVVVTMGAPYRYRSAFQNPSGVIHRSSVSSTSGSTSGSPRTGSGKHSDISCCGCWDTFSSGPIRICHVRHVVLAVRLAVPARGKQKLESPAVGVVDVEIGPPTWGPRRSGVELRTPNLD